MELLEKVENLEKFPVYERPWKLMVTDLFMELIGKLLAVLSAATPSDINIFPLKPVNTFLK